MSEPWTPFQRATLAPQDEAILGSKDPLIFKNNLYQVWVRKLDPQPGGWPGMYHLSIRRLDREAVHDWRHLQRIKNEIIGPEHEGVELYPAEDRLVDEANQFHLWVLVDGGMRFPFGFAERLVSDIPEGKSVQRPFDDPPSDLNRRAGDAKTMKVRA
jgi:hypothetical protein